MIARGSTVFGSLPDRRKGKALGQIPATHESPKAPRERSWDWSDTRAFDAVLDHAGWDGAATAHAWFDLDEDPEHDPPQKKGAYKLPHHEVIDGRLRVVWRGVVAAMSVINGGRGGVDIPEADKRRVYDHLAAHYRQFDEEPPAFGGE